MKTDETVGKKDSPECLLTSKHNSVAGVKVNGSQKVRKNPVENTHCCAKLLHLEAKTTIE